MSRLKDLTGQRFGRLTILYRDVEGEKNYKSKVARWLCKCDCGNEKSVMSSKLTSGNTKSCGCLNREMISERSKKYNEYDLTGEFGVGFTHDNREFHFDLDDYEKIKEYRWYYANTGYLTAYEPNSGDKILLHRFIMNAQKEDIVDHIYGNKFDNRKSKLRLVNKVQNQQNQVRKNNKHGRTGIVFQNNSWGYVIQANYKREKKMGFETFEEAVKAREEAEDRLHGEYKSYEYRTEED